MTSPPTTSFRPVPSPLPPQGASLTAPACELLLLGERHRLRRDCREGRVLPRLDPRRHRHDLAVHGLRVGRRRGVSYSLRARATDNSGAAVDSATRWSPSRARRRDPTVSLTAPADNASFRAPASISYSATASDPNGKVTRVEFFRGTTLVGRDNKAPYAASESGVGIGTYNLEGAGDRQQRRGRRQCDSHDHRHKCEQPKSIGVTHLARERRHLHRAGGHLVRGQRVRLRRNRQQGRVLPRLDAGRTARTSPYTASESGVSAGTYTLKARATDNGGAVVDSATRSVTVSAAATRPQRSVTAPSNGATFTAPASYTFSANASDSDGTVTKVEFFRGTTLVDTDTLLAVFGERLRRRRRQLRADGKGDRLRRRDDHELTGEHHRQRRSQRPRRGLRVRRGRGLDAP